jgi:hypothetical protein
VTPRRLTARPAVLVSTSDKAAGSAIAPLVLRPQI